MSRLTLLLLTLCAWTALLAGCQADPKIWRGSQKFLNIHAVAFTPQGDGLVMIGPRRGGEGETNLTAYYYMHLPTMIGRRIGYGQHALGQALLCPFENLIAAPTYFPAVDGQPQRCGYAIYSLPTGQLVRQVGVDDSGLFVEHQAGLPAQSQPATADDSPSPADVWRRILPTPPTPQQIERARRHRTRWLVRGALNEPPTQQADGQTFYVLDGPDGRHRLFLRFRPPSKKPEIAANPDGEGYAYGFLLDSQTGKRFMLYTTSGTDQFFDSVGSAMIAGPAWLVSQPIKLIRGE